MITIQLILCYFFTVIRGLYKAFQRVKGHLLAREAYDMICIGLLQKSYVKVIVVCTIVRMFLHCWVNSWVKALNHALLVGTCWQECLLIMSEDVLGIKPKSHTWMKHLEVASATFPHAISSWKCIKRGLICHLLCIQHHMWAICPWWEVQLSLMGHKNAGLCFVCLKELLLLQGNYYWIMLSFTVLFLVSVSENNLCPSSNNTTCKGLFWKI